MNTEPTKLCAAYERFLDQPLALAPIDRAVVLFHAKDCAVCLGLAVTRSAPAAATATAVPQADPADQAPPPGRDVVYWPPPMQAGGELEVLALAPATLGAAGPERPAPAPHPRFFSLEIVLDGPNRTELREQVAQAVAHSPRNLVVTSRQATTPAATPASGGATATANAAWIRMHARNGPQDRGVYLIVVPQPSWSQVPFVMRELLRTDETLEQSLQALQRKGIAVTHRPPGT